MKNRLSKFVKQPPTGGEYRSISICIDQGTLLEMKEQHQPDKISHQSFDNVFLLKPNTIFRHYIDSLLPYLENNGQINGDLVKIKVRGGPYLPGSQPSVKKSSV